MTLSAAATEAQPPDFKQFFKMPNLRERFQRVRIRIRNWAHRHARSHELGRPQTQTGQVAEERAEEPEVAQEPTDHRGFALYTERGPGVHPATMEAAVVLARALIQGESWVDDIHTFGLMHTSPSGPNYQALRTDERPPRTVEYRRNPDQGGGSSEIGEQDDEDAVGNTLDEIDEADEQGSPDEDGEDREDSDESEDSHDDESDEQRWRRLLGEPPRDISRNF